MFIYSMISASVGLGVFNLLLMSEAFLNGRQGCILDRVLRPGRSQIEIDASFTYKVGPQDPMSFNFFFEFLELDR